jgi:hypothetical protein
MPDNDVSGYGKDVPAPAGRQPYHYIKRLPPYRQKAVYDRIFRRFFKASRRLEFAKECAGEAFLRLWQSPNDLTTAPAPVFPPTAAWLQRVEDALVAFATGEMMRHVRAQVTRQNGVKLPREGTDGAAWTARHIGDLSGLDQNKEQLDLPQAGSSTQKVVSIIRIDTEIPVRSDPDTLRNLTDQDAQARIERLENALSQPHVIAALRSKLAEHPHADPLVLEVLNEIYKALCHPDPDISDKILRGDAEGEKSADSDDNAPDTKQSRANRQQINHKLLLSLLVQNGSGSDWDQKKLYTTVAKLFRHAKSIRHGLAADGLLPFEERPGSGHNQRPRERATIASALPCEGNQS